MKKLQITIVLISIIGLISIIPITITIFTYGIGNTLVYLWLYPIFLLSTLLILGKVKGGYLLTFITSLTYSTLLTNEVGKYLIFNFRENILFWILLFPFLTFLTLIPLTIIFLTINSKYTKAIKLISILLAISFFIFPIAEKFNKDYSDDIFINAKIDKLGKIIFYCNPHFGDSRTFIVTTRSKKIEKQIKQYGEYYQGSYFLHNTSIIKNFHFSELQSITLTKIGVHEISPQLTWTTKEIKGNIKFLQP